VGAWVWGRPDVIIQHTDSKPAQQRLVCVAKHVPEDGEPCPETFMMINDLGLTFGRANVLNRNSLGSVNFEGWSQTPVWRDSKECIGNLPKSASGTLEFPVVSEEGRKFLAGLLLQLFRRAASRPVRGRALPAEVQGRRRETRHHNRRMGGRVQA
jgi:hypothetical protein